MALGLLLLAPATPADAAPSHSAAARNAASPAALKSADAAALDNDASDYGSNFGGVNLYLRVFINGGSQGRFAHFRLRGSQLWVSHYALQRLGFILPPGTPDPVALQSLPGVQVHYNAAAQTVAIVAPISMLNLATTHLANTGGPEPTPTSSPGLLLNYDLYGNHSEGSGNSLNAFTELRAFDGIGVFDNTALINTSNGGAQGWNTHTVRLDTSWRASFPHRMLDLTIGDTLTGALPWTRSTRIAGIQIGRDFALQPYRITTPLQAFFGQATLPSNVDLYVNGLKTYQGQVPAGNFTLTSHPPVTGVGHAQMVLTNALGQIVTQNFSFYNATNLLAKGLSDWSASAGFVRRNYGIDSFDYGHDPMASGSLRYGITNGFTGMAHAEAISGLWNAGVGGVWLAGLDGVVHASLAASDNHGDHGSQYGLGYHWNNRRFSLSFNALGTRGDYADVATRYGLPPPRLSASASFGFNTPEAGSFNLGYIQLHYPDQTASSYANFGWSKSFGGNAWLSLSVNRNLAGPGGTTVFLSFSFFLGNNTQFSAAANHSSGATSYSIAASHQIPQAGGVGWRAQADIGDNSNGGLGEISYLGPYGRYTGGIQTIAGNVNAYADASGSLVFMNGDLFAARRIYGSFAVVNTDGFAGVPVTLENNLVGKTDSQGMLLVTRLNAWQRNRIGIEPLQLPANVRINKTTLNATPRGQSGTLVHFKIERVRAASVILVNAAGKSLPVGSRVRIQGQPARGSIVGYGGAVYLDTLEKHNTLEVTTPKGGTCRVSFEYHRVDGTIPQIGPLTCQPKAQKQ